MIDTKSKVLKTSILAALVGFSQMAIADDVKDDGYRQINQVVWDKTGEKPFLLVNNSEIPQNEGNLVFIRPADNDELETSTNIGVDGKFQVSLQPGHFSQVLYCSGSQNISLTTTSLKTNDLVESNLQIIDIAPQQNNFFYVDVDDVTQIPSMRKIDAETANSLLKDMPLQTHQISRVYGDCPEPQVVVAAPEPEREKVELFKPFRLNVLFKFDKDEVQPMYNQRIQDLANFMVENPNTIAVIEGHTDSIGTVPYNQNLSERRAVAVKNELVKRYGADANRLTTAGYGESKPVDTNNTDQGRQNNRRVVAIVTPK